MKIQASLYGFVKAIYKTATAINRLSDKMLLLKPLLNDMLTKEEKHKPLFRWLRIIQGIWPLTFTLILVESLFIIFWNFTYWHRSFQKSNASAMSICHMQSKGDRNIISGDAFENFNQFSLKMSAMYLRPKLLSCTWNLNAS